MCCLAVILTGCDELLSALDNPIQTTLSMTTTDVKLTVGDTYQRQATTASPATIVYTSSDATVATVDANGVVEAIAEGEATITASVAEVDYWTAASTSYKVIVKSAFVAATDITLDQTMKVIKLGGDALTITATTVPSDANYTWESDAAAIATVDETGKVTPVGVGIATITAKSGDVKATCKIFVGNEVDLSTKTADYPVENYDILKNTLDGSYALTIPDGYKVAFAGLTTTKTVTCSGDATIILADGSTNTVDVSGTAYKAGIKVGPTDKTLIIDVETAGTGKLTAKGGGFAAGIGTNVNSTGGNIVINGGTVTATGGSDAAGIGTGVSDPTNTCGTITINGGTVTATGGAWAAGIGTGYAYMSSTNTCVAITINGGTVTATGGAYGAGIGTGYAQNNNSNTCGVITINGGSVNAAGGDNGAGIGTGCADASSGDATAECGNIIIAGGTVIATGGAYGAGIGTGVTDAPNPAKTASQTCGAITIGTGVTSVIATKGSYAPYSIGVGYKALSGGPENQTCGTITIGGDATTYAAGVTTSPFTYPTAP